MESTPRHCTIRAGEEEDAKAISLLVSSVTQEHIAPNLSPAGAAHLLGEMAETSIVALFQRGVRFFVAETGDVVVGIAAVQPPAHLYYLFVKTDYQRRGIGRLLWLHVRDWILREQPATTTITVNSSPNAIAAYQKLGFERVGCLTKRNEVCYQPMDWIHSPS